MILNYNDITTIGTAEASKALILDSSSNISGINNLTSNRLLLGTSTDSTVTRLISALDSTITTGNTRRQITLGKAASTNNQIEIAFNWIADGSSSNYMSLGLFGTSSIINILGNGNVGIGNTSPSYKLDVTGDINLTGSLRFSGTALTSTVAELNYLDLTTGPGTAEASKALVLDSNRNINNINILGSIQSTINSTSVTTINNSTVTSNYDLYLRRNTSVNGNSHGIAFMHTTNDPTTTLPGSSILYTRVDYGSGHLSFNTAQNERLRITAAGNIGIGLINPSYTLDISGDLNISGNYRSAGSIVSFSAIAGVTAGTAEASKALILDINKDITSIRNITATGLTITNLINKLAGTTAVTSDFNKLASITASATELNYNDITTIGTAEAGKALILDVNKDIISIRNITATGLTITNLTLGSTAITATGAEINKLAGTTAITADFNKLASVTATASQLNYLSGTTLGTITASKALTVDSSSNINSILQLKKTASGQQIYFENGTSTGTIYHTLNSSLNIGTISSNDLVFQTNNTNRVTITSTGLMNIQTGWQISGTTVTATAAELNYVDITTEGTAQASKALVLDSNKDIISIRRISTTNISLNNATTYPTVLHCGSTTADRIIGVFNNTTSFYGFGAADNLLKIQGGHSTGIAFYTSASNSSIGTEQMRISSTSTSILQTTSSTNSTSGALIVSGGIGCAG